MFQHYSSSFFLQHLLSSSTTTGMSTNSERRKSCCLSRPISGSAAGSGTLTLVFASDALNDDIPISICILVALMLTALLPWKFLNDSASEISNTCPFAILGRIDVGLDAILGTLTRDPCSPRGSKYTPCELSISAFN